MYYENNFSSIAKNMKILESGRAEGLRGFLLLPKSINESTLPIIPAKIPSSFEDYNYHMFCIAYEGNIYLRNLFSSIVKNLI
jgi:hypothetical protein